MHPAYMRRPQVALDLAKVLRNLGIIASFQIGQKVDLLKGTDYVWDQNKEPEHVSEVALYQKKYLKLNLRWACGLDSHSHVCGGRRTIKDAELCARATAADGTCSSPCGSLAVPASAKRPSRFRSRCPPRSRTSVRPRSRWVQDWIRWDRLSPTLLDQRTVRGRRTADGEPELGACILVSGLRSQVCILVSRALRRERF